MHPENHYWMITSRLEDERLRLKKWDGFWTFRHLLPALGRARPGGRGGRGMKLSPASQTFRKLRRKRDCGHPPPQPAPETTVPPTHEPMATESRLSFVDFSRAHRTIRGKRQAGCGHREAPVLEAMMPGAVTEPDTRGTSCQPKHHAVNQTGLRSEQRPRRFGSANSN